MFLKFLLRKKRERRRGIGQYERINKHEGEEEETCSEAEVTVRRRKARCLFKLGRSRPGPRTSKQYSSEIELLRSGHGIVRDERIGKDEEEKEKTSRMGHGIRRTEEEEISSEKEEEITSEEQKEKSSETEVTVPRTKKKRLFKSGKVSWRRFTKVVKNHGFRLVCQLAESHILQHLPPYLPA